MEHTTKKRVTTRKVKVGGKVYEYQLKAIWVSPEVHKQVKHKATEEDINMNDIIQRALTHYYGE